MIVIQNHGRPRTSRHTLTVTIITTSKQSKLDVRIRVYRDDRIVAPWERQESLLLHTKESL